MNNFRYLFLFSQLKQKILIWFVNIRIKLLARFGILKRPLQCSCQTQQNVQIRTFKETIAVFISNAISDHEMNFETKHTIKNDFRFKLGKS